ncbi:MAG TPA: hypothetical protein VH482_05065 [Thermomicrobiales bacterium]
MLLDAGPLGLVTNPRGDSDALQCRLWLRALLAKDVEVGVPEITDYEVRRELLRVGKLAGLRRLESLTALQGVTYFPITTEAMRLAATFWSTVRRQGRPTADPSALDCDMILAALADTLRLQGRDVVVATTNLRHLSLFVPAAAWNEILAE